MKCVFCKREGGAIEDCIHVGWLPSFVDGDAIVDRPACGVCADARGLVPPDDEEPPE